MCTSGRCAWTFRIEGEDISAGQAAFDTHRCEDFPRDQGRPRLPAKVKEELAWIFLLLFLKPWVSASFCLQFLPAAPDPRCWHRCRHTTV